MSDQAIDIPALAEHLVGVDGLFPRDGRLALAVYQLLAEGEPVSVERLAARTRRVEARSTDPITGETVSMSLKDGGVRELEPASAVLSMARADFPMGDDVVPAACGPINFFGSDESGRTFTERVDGTFLLTIKQGLELARLINRAVVGSALTR